MRRSLPALSVALAVVAFAPAGAVDLVLGPAEIERALLLARQPEPERARFHDRYLVVLGDSTADQLEVVTEFRRVVLAAEDHIRQGDHMFSARQANDTIRPWRGKITLVLHLRFHPQNVLVRVPAYEIAVGQPRLAVMDVRRTPLYGLQGRSQKRGAAAPLFGGIVESDVDAVGIGQAKRTVRVLLEGKDITGTTIDFAGLE